MLSIILYWEGKCEAGVLSVSYLNIGLSKSNLSPGTNTSNSLEDAGASWVSVYWTHLVTASCKSDLQCWCFNHAAIYSYETAEVKLSKSNSRSTRYRAGQLLPFRWIPSVDQFPNQYFPLMKTSNVFRFWHKRVVKAPIPSSTKVTRWAISAYPKSWMRFLPTPGGT